MTDPTYSSTGLTGIVDHMNENIAYWDAGVTKLDWKKELPVISITSKVSQQ